MMVAGMSAQEEAVRSVKLLPESWNQASMFGHCLQEDVHAAYLISFQVAARGYPAELGHR